MSSVARCHTRVAGFNIPELLISAALLAVLVTSLFSLTAESSALLGDSEVDQAVQQEGHRAFSLLYEIIQRAGNSERNGVTYPRVVDDGAGLELTLPQDRDGDGTAFDPVAGEVEWGDVLSIRLEDDYRLSLWRGAGRLATLARNVSFVRFNTDATDPTLQPEQIGILLETRRQGGGAGDAVFSFTIRVRMRNHWIPSS